MLVGRKHTGNFQHGKKASILSDVATCPTCRRRFRYSTFFSTLNTCTLFLDTMDARISVVLQTMSERKRHFSMGDLHSNVGVKVTISSLRHTACLVSSSTHLMSNRLCASVFLSFSTKISPVSFCISHTALQILGQIHLAPTARSFAHFELLEHSASSRFEWSVDCFFLQDTRE